MFPVALRFPTCEDAQTVRIASQVACSNGCISFVLMSVCSSVSFPTSTHACRPLDVHLHNGAHYPSHLWLLPCELHNLRRGDHDGLLRYSLRHAVVLRLLQADEGPLVLPYRNLYQLVGHPNSHLDLLTPTKRFSSVLLQPTLETCV